MKRLVYGGAIAAIVACTVAASAPTSIPKPQPSPRVSVDELPTITPDSFKVLIHWGKPVVIDNWGPVTGYKITATLDRTGLVASLPSSKALTDTSYVIAGLRPAAGDSATMIAKVWSTRLGLTSGTFSQGKRVIKSQVTPPPPPPPISIDSSTSLKSIILMPAAGSVETGKAIQFCAFAQTLDNTIGMTTNSAPVASCCTLLQSLPNHRPNCDPVMVQSSTAVPA